MARRSRNRLVSLILISAILPLSGCVTLKGLGSGTIPVSRDFIELHGAYATPIAQDLVAAIPVQSGQNLPVIHIKGAETAFGTALTLELRKKGYGIVSEAQQAVGGYHTLTYVIDQLDDGQLLASIAIDTLMLSRIYRIDGNALQPASPLSLMRSTAS